jgi:signal transduction histidine kinase
VEQQFSQAQQLDAAARLARGIAHDFNNVLTLVKGYANLLAERPHDPAFVAMGLKEIIAATETASELTAKILAFGRKQVIEARPVELTEVVHAMTPLLSGLVGNSVHLATDAPERVRPVLAHPIQLEQVLMNLAVNARDAMPGGGVLRIQVRDSGPSVCLEVADTGIGMSEEVRARAFEPFFTTKEPGKGTGLGLSIVHGIVTQSGGTISVESAPGRGTTFRIFLPPAPTSHAGEPRPNEPRP